jgi:hypothetical protein
MYDIVLHDGMLQQPMFVFSQRRFTAYEITVSSAAATSITAAAAAAARSDHNIYIILLLAYVHVANLMYVHDSYTCMSAYKKQQ